jgi:hypothetical protein
MLEIVFSENPQRFFPPYKTLDLFLKCFSPKALGRGGYWDLKWELCALEPHLQPFSLYLFF